jgi:hypothetical protein
MPMNLMDLQTKLLKAARREPVREDVPYAFEKRIMARLSGKTAHDVWAIWSAALWRMTAPCVAIMLLLTAWTFVSPEAPGTTGDLDLEIEQAVMAAVDQEPAPDFIW